MEVVDAKSLTFSRKPTKETPRFTALKNLKIGQAMVVSEAEWKQKSTAGWLNYICRVGRIAAKYNVRKINAESYAIIRVA